MRFARSFSVAVSVIAVAVTALAQNPTFTARTDLVLVPVLVTDKNQNPVSGLQQSDFTILDNGREQKIAVFEEIKSTDAPIHRATREGFFSNSLADGGGPPRRLTII